MGLAGDTYGDQDEEHRSHDQLSSLQCVGVGLGAEGKSFSVPQTPLFILMFTDNQLVTTKATLHIYTPVPCAHWWPV